MQIDQERLEALRPQLAQNGVNPDQLPSPGTPEWRTMIRDLSIKNPLLAQEVASLEYDPDELANSELVERQASRASSRTGLVDILKSPFRTKTVNGDAVPNTALMRNLLIGTGVAAALAFYFLIPSSPAGNAVAKKSPTETTTKTPAGSDSPEAGTDTTVLPEDGVPAPDNSVPTNPLAGMPSPQHPDDAAALADPSGLGEPTPSAPDAAGLADPSGLGEPTPPASETYTPEPEPVALTSANSPAPVGTTRVPDTTIPNDFEDTSLPDTVVPDTAPQYAAAMAAAPKPQVVASTSLPGPKVRPPVVIRKPRPVPVSQETPLLVRTSTDQQKQAAWAGLNRTSSAQDGSSAGEGDAKSAGARVRLLARTSTESGSKAGRAYTLVSASSTSGAGQESEARSARAGIHTVAGQPPVRLTLASSSAQANSSSSDGGQEGDAGRQEGNARPARAGIHTVAGQPPVRPTLAANGTQTAATQSALERSSNAAEVGASLKSSSGEKASPVSLSGSASAAMAAGAAHNRMGLLSSQSTAVAAEGAGVDCAGSGQYGLSSTVSAQDSGRTAASDSMTTGAGGNAAAPTLPYAVGRAVAAKLLVGVAAMANAESSLPVYAESADGATWRGTAVVDGQGRLRVTFDAVLINNREYGLIADAYGADGVLGMPARTRLTSPNLAANLLAGLAGGVKSFADAMINQRSVSVQSSGSTSVVTSSAENPPNFWISAAGGLLGSVGVPETKSGMVNVADVQPGAALRIVVRRTTSGE